MLSQWVSGDLELNELKAGKVPVCIRKDYIFYLEYFEGLLWFHTDVKRWSARVKESFKDDCAKLEELVGKPLFALIREDDIKLERFAKAVGWSKKCQIRLLDGTMAFIYTSVV
jgi:hypothetical protein